MAVINLFQGRPVGVGSQISPGQANLGTAGAGALLSTGLGFANSYARRAQSIANTLNAEIKMKQRRQEAEQRAINERIQAAQNNLEYTNSLTTARDSMQKFIDGKLQQQRDARGMPNVDPATVGKELNEYNKKLYGELAKNIKDPVTRMRFQAAYNKMASDASLGAQQQFRATQIKNQQDVFREQLEKSTDGAVNSNPASIQSQIDHVNESIDNAYKAGLINRHEAYGLKKAAQKKIVLGSLDNYTVQNPEEAKKLLEEGKIPGLTATEKQRALDKANGLIIEKAAVTDRLFKEARKARTEAANSKKLELQIAMADSSKVPDDMRARIEKERAVLGEKNYYTVLKEYYEKSKAKTKQVETESAIATRIQNGESLDGIPKKAQQTYFDNKLKETKRRLEESGQSMSEIRIAGMMASQIRAPIKSFQNRLSAARVNGTLEEKIDANLGIRDIIKSGNKEALKGMDKEVMEYYGIFDRYLKYGLTPEDAARRTDQLLGSATDPKVIEERARKFNDTELRSRGTKKQPAFDVKKWLNETLFDDDYWSIRELFGMSQNLELEDGVETEIREIIETAFKRTGDVDAAKAAAAEIIKANFGVSQLGNGPVISKRPPESFAPKVPPAFIKKQIAVAAMDKEADLPKGIKPESVFIESDPLVVSTVNGERIVSFPMRYVDPVTGVVVPVYDKKGRAMRFVMDQPGMLKEYGKQQIDDTNKQREERKASFNAVFDALGRIGK